MHRALIIIIINKMITKNHYSNTWDHAYGAITATREEFTQFMWWMQNTENSAKLPLTLSQSIWDRSLPIGYYHL